MTYRGELLKIIVRGEMIMLEAISKGLKSSESDKFQKIRDEVESSRCIYFDYNPQFCKPKYRK